MNIDLILDVFSEDEFLIADDLDDAIIGIDEDAMRIIYSVTKIIDILMNRDNMTKEEAFDFFEYNISSAYTGNKTPIWCHDELI